VEWVTDCATDGYRGYGCGADLLCLDTCAICGNPSAGDCCTANGTIGCSDMICCEAVCSLDPFCCEVEWDENCATYGFNNSGAGAAEQCPDLCGTVVCPDGPVTFLDPPTGTIDARQPYPPWNESQRQGIDTIVAEAPAGAERRECWGATDTAAVASSIEVADVVDHGDGTFTLTLAKPTSAGEVTMVTYSATGGNTHTGVFVSHPGNINGDAQADAGDLETMINCCLNRLCEPGATPEETPYRCDIDRSGRITPADLLRAIDLLNGGDAYDPWLNTPLPQPTDGQ
jgi:hypothetical protein